MLTMDDGDVPMEIEQAVIVVDEYEKALVVALYAVGW